MLTKKLNLKITLNILLISAFSAINGAERNKLTDMIFTKNKAKPQEEQPTPNVTVTSYPKVTITSEAVSTPVPNDPTKASNSKKERKTTATPVAEDRKEEPKEELTTEQQAEAEKIQAAAKKIKDHLQEIDAAKDTFDDLGDPNAQQILRELQPDALGMPYPDPKFPAQTATTFTLRQSMFETLESFLDRIIAAGQFKAAHEFKSSTTTKEYAEVSEDSGKILSKYVALITTMIKRQSTERNNLSLKHRLEFKEQTEPMRRLLKANNQRYSKGSINTHRIEHNLKELLQILAELEQSDNSLLGQLNADEELIHKICLETLALHPTLSNQPPIPNRRTLTVLQPTPTEALK